jgi:hypothetical protein
VRTWNLKQQFLFEVHSKMWAAVQMKASLLVSCPLHVETQTLKSPGILQRHYAALCPPPWPVSSVSVVKGPDCPTNKGHKHWDRVILEATVRTDDSVMEHPS